MRYYEQRKQKGLYDPRFEHDNCGVGFVVDIKGRKSHKIVLQGLEALKRLSHRGAVGADPKSGDGAGLLIQIPHGFYETVFPGLPRFGSYGTGLVFFPQSSRMCGICKDIFKKIVEQEGQIFVGFRKVGVDDSGIGESARASQPVIEQVFIAKGKQVNTKQEFERKLYLIRRKIEKEIRSEGFYICSLSSKTIVYKGQLMPSQVEKYFPELSDPGLLSAIALVHSRYSTNTFPSWSLAQPFRLLAHNGEINTLRGNINWMKARGLDVIQEGGSDSAALDNVLELLLMEGRPLPHVLMMLIPQAWEHNKLMDSKLKDFYRYNACFMEPWDGPAAIAVTDGDSVGAVLDRNGLRPARYIVTDQDIVIMASEVGVLDIPAESIVKSGRLEPGKIFFVDTVKGKIISNDDVKYKAAGARPYSSWLAKNMVDLESLPKISSRQDSQKDLNRLLKAFGYTREDMKTILKPMAEKGKEPVGSMGNDTPHAVLSNKPQLVYNYFKQLFAQVTNPPIDPIREEIVMSLESYLGAKEDILKETADHCRKIRVKRPILTNEETEKIRFIMKNGFKAKTISTLFSNEKDFISSINRVCGEVEAAIGEGYSFIILSDRGVDNKNIALPALLVTGAVHHFLIEKALRTKVSIIIESGEPREVHHFALLFGYGADCVNPYLAYEAVSLLSYEKDIVLDARTAVENYRHAVDHGILKILSKMGISTLHSYRGAQMFEALGLADDVIEKCFAGTPSRIGGASFAELAKDVISRHDNAFKASSTILETGGVYQWKRDGETHLWNPDTISALQDSVRREDYSRFQEFSSLINDQSKNPATLRSLLRIKSAKPIPIEQVEPVSEILKRFVTGAMSFGSISRGAHETLARAMNKIGGKSNTGEGGEDPERFKDDRRSAIKQVASGRFGVNTHYLVNADELQIKIAQGAKPGEGGQLPGHKVSAIIAKTRYTTPGVTLISPPPHHDIYSIEDLAQLIFDLKNVNPRARISVKLVSEIGVGTVAAGVAKGHADMILISGGDGGTGASPISSIRNAGLPWELGLSETHQTLILNNLRNRVRLQTDGQMRTGRDVAIATLLGAEEYGFCTAALITVGCVMLRHCHLNNCSVGVATQDEYLSSRFAGKPEYIINFLTFVAQELREIMASLGFKTIDEMVGRVDLLELNNEILSWKAKNIDYSSILYKPETVNSQPIHCTQKQDHNIEKVLDRKLIELAKDAIESKKPVYIETEIKNYNRTTGAMISGEVCRKYGAEGLPNDTIKIKLNGAAGQSFGAFLAHGITLELEGLANDYVGKGISGGKIIVYPDKKSIYDPSKNIIIGNTAFYGAISGEAYINGIAGERFCIRNSGLTAVVEGVGDHGCEYMTGGRVLILGNTGRNFAAGMSGGIAYVYDKNDELEGKCNLDMVEIVQLTKEDESFVLKLLNKYFIHAKSKMAKRIIDNFTRERRSFKKVFPYEYRRVLEERAMNEEELELLGMTDV